jgi:hypothetical protein
VIVCVRDVSDCFEAKDAIFRDNNVNEFISYRGAMDRSYILLDCRFCLSAYASRYIPVLCQPEARDKPFYTKIRFPRNELHIVTQHPESDYTLHSDSEKLSNV